MLGRVPFLFYLTNGLHYVELFYILFVAKLGGMKICT